MNGNTCHYFFKSILCWVLFVQFFVVNASAQQTVPAATMQQVYEAIKTDYKYGLVMVPENDSFKLDCPSVFRKGNSWYMTYVVFNGRGYETWLSKSKDLLHWKKQGRILSFSDSTDWDSNQKAGYIALQNTSWGGDYKLKKFKRKYWLSYFGGKDPGYEAGPLAIGTAYTSHNPTKSHQWNRFSKPALTASDSDVRWWENKKLFKSSVIHDKTNSLGYPFVMYYNANGDTSNNTPKWRWFERIGMAVSNDMVHWKRYQTEPVMQHRIGITGDAVVQKMGDLWVMFYFGAFWEGRKDAFNRFACSYDLIHWTDWTGEDLIKSSTVYDAKFAHKSYVVKHKGIVYHFYCAVNAKDQRGIAVATSVDKGKSELEFFKQ